jgi:phosphatidylglycerophosphate synthase
VASRPWDSRLANRLVRPLSNTPVHPNHVTTLGLAVGLAAAASYARGTPAAANVGALGYVVSAILDHADGELARLTGKTSTFGHSYDRAADLTVKLSLFAGMGLSVRHGQLGWMGPVFGITAGLAVITIFSLRSSMSRWRGRAAFDQPGWGGFEIEDTLYLVAPVTWLGWLEPFVVAAGLGAPVFALWVARQWMITRTHRAAPIPERPSPRRDDVRPEVHP